MWKMFSVTIGLLIVTACALDASAQTKDRVIMWPPLPIGQIKSAAPGIKLSPITEAVKIMDISVAGSSVTPGQSFAAGDDWLRTLTLRLRNVSGQRIVGVTMRFGLPETRLEDSRQIGFMLEYGNIGSGGIPPDGREPVKAGGEFELKFNDAQYQRTLQMFAKRAGTTSFTKVWLGITTVQFEDGSIWSSGCLKAINPSVSCSRAAT